jgi:hypothetical protein
MFKSMLKKEFTELAAPFLLAFGVLATVIVQAVSQSRRHFDQQGAWMLDADFVYPFLIISLCLAAAMGLVQSLSEDVQGTCRYVLSFPGGCRRILKLKLACGLAVWLCWGSVVVALSFLGMFFERGPDAEPLQKLFDPVLRILVCVPVVYLGAFLTALRRANWFFSRLMPAVGALACWFILPYLPTWWIVAPLATVVLGAVLIILMFHVASTRDFA